MCLLCSARDGKRDDKSFASSRGMGAAQCVDTLPLHRSARNSSGYIEASGPVDVDVLRAVRGIEWM